VVSERNRDQSQAKEVFRTFVSFVPLWCNSISETLRLCVRFFWVRGVWGSAERWARRYFEDDDEDSLPRGRLGGGGRTIGLHRDGFTDLAHYPEIRWNNL